MTVAYLLKHDKFGSNFVLIKQNLPNSIILPPKNGGFKARSHSMRKANSQLIIIDEFLMSYLASGNWVAEMLKPSNIFTSRRGKAAEMFNVCRGLQVRKETGLLTLFCLLR